MNYQMHRPPPPVGRFVEFFWCFETTDAAAGRERVLPDGSSELIIDLLDMPRRRFDRDCPARATEYRRAWLSGPQSEYLVIDVLPTACMIGAHFRPGGLSAFLPFPAESLGGRVEHADGVWDDSILRLREALQNTSSATQRFWLLDRFLLGKLRPALGQDRWIDEALTRLSAAPSAESIAALAERAGLSQKHFIHQFRRRVGLTPRKFARLRRFQEALASLQRQDRVDWAGLACAAGYFDQSHLIRDFQSFCGLSPTAYLAARQGEPNYLPEPTP